MTTERQRKVRFHSRVQFKTIRHVANFSDEEIAAGWYCKRDFMRMSDEVSEIAKLVSKGEEEYNGEELCTRGLEHLVEEDVADYRAEKMIASIDAVLDEQDEQLVEDIYDPYMIADVYSEIVTPLLREAYLVGLRDAKEAAAAAAMIPDTLEAAEKEENVVPVAKADRDITEMEETEFSGSERASDDDEGEEKLNTSLNSLGTEISPEKVPLKKEVVDKPDKDKMEQKRKESQKKQALATKSTSSADETSAAGAGKGTRRKAIDRKGGTEMSPFIVRRDGTMSFRNYDMEHRKLEQSKRNKACIKSSLFSVLNGEDEEDENFAEFLAQKGNAKPKESKLYATTSWLKKKKLSSSSTPSTTAKLKKKTAGEWSKVAMNNKR